MNAGARVLKWFKSLTSGKKKKSAHDDPSTEENRGGDPHDPGGEEGAHQQDAAGNEKGSRTTSTASTKQNWLSRKFSSSAASLRGDKAKEIKALRQRERRASTSDLRDKGRNKIPLDDVLKMGFFERKGGTPSSPKGKGGAKARRPSIQSVNSGGSSGHFSRSSVS